MRRLRRSSSPRGDVGGTSSKCPKITPLRSVVIFAPGYNPGGLFIGIISASAAHSECSYMDSSSYGWACEKQVWVAGITEDGKDGWVGWKANDVAIFKLESRSLKMYHMRSERTFTLQLPSETLWKLHFNMLHAGDKVEVSVPTDQEVHHVFF